MKNHKKTTIFIIFLTLLYLVAHILTLKLFPFIHSDESWLSNLSRAMLVNHDIGVTESVFDLYPRHPHAIKVIFHLLQAGVIKIFGYGIFGMRSISLLAGLLSLIVYYKLLKKIGLSGKFSIITTIFLAVDVQFIYASHFARQEIIILLAMLASLYIYFKKEDHPGYGWDMILGGVIGLCIGVHPNSFIISLPIVLIYLYDGLVLRQKTFKNLLAYGLTLTVFAAIFVGLSFSLDPHFLTNYLNYGDEFGINHDAGSKIKQLKYFYLKLFYGVSGTYYTPNIKMELAAFAATIVWTLWEVVHRIRIESNKVKLVLAVVGIHLGIVIIGRYNQTSILFIFPLIYILLGCLVSELENKKKFLGQVLSAVVIVALAVNSFVNIQPHLKGDYGHYLDEIGKVVRPDEKVLANLNAEYYFDYECLLDYRNLAYLKEHDISFEDYIRENEIEYIIYSEEMDFIYDTRPVWNGIYGNMYYYYEDMKTFFDESCELVHEFEEATYGMRIVRYIRTAPWKIRIYKVNGAMMEKSVG